MLNEITKVNFDTIREAAQDGENITIIINGQYYDLDAEAPAGTDPFIEGVKFAAALIEDNRARMNFMFQANDARNPKTTKRAIACNDARNKEAKNESDFLLHIIKPEAGFDTWQKEYHGGKLWKLEG